MAVLSGQMAVLSGRMAVLSGQMAVLSGQTVASWAQMDGSWAQMDGSWEQMALSKDERSMESMALISTGVTRSTAVAMVCLVELKDEWWAGLRSDGLRWGDLHLAD